MEPVENARAEGRSGDPFTRGPRVELSLFTDTVSNQVGSINVRPARKLHTLKAGTFAVTQWEP